MHSGVVTLQRGAGLCYRFLAHPCSSICRPTAFTFELLQITGHYYDILGDELTYKATQNLQDEASLIVIMDDFEEAFVRDGHLVAFRAYIQDPSATVYGQVWRPQTESGTYELVYQERLEAGGISGDTMMEVTTRPFVRRGDKIGLHWPGLPAVAYFIQEAYFQCSPLSYEKVSYSQQFAREQTTVKTVGDVIQMLHESAECKRYHFSAHLVSAGKESGDPFIMLLSANGF